ncbi:hypothetical protein F9B85_03560 [Heliorestis acidaminivorans]|uniref:Uncharacterized protein n=1 Tax=Heliorestis acidaminivorans TaxID=553427 RepID=A0A6I0F886_9FIRM|nr:hypothetical protein [Heliorestis acidaminivorans]KAB2953708.1 hypothetical protein F9B85_03560 [Heliorestis acidaminivorans]
MISKKERKQLSPSLSQESVQPVPVCTGFFFCLKKKEVSKVGIGRLKTFIDVIELALLKSGQGVMIIL